MPIIQGLYINVREHQTVITKNGQSRENGNIGYTIHITKTKTIPKAHHDT